MLGRIIVLLVLILVLIGGGIIWLDYLNVIDAKTALAPLYRLIVGQGRTGLPVDDDEFINIDAERLAIRLEALALKQLDIETQEADIAARRAELEQLAEQLEEDRRAIEEIMETLRNDELSAENMNREIEGISQRLTNMQPERAVAIIMGLPDQEAINVIRKTEEIAQRDGTGNLVPYWLQLMAETDEGARRAADLQRKMVIGFP